jgi:DNA-binding MarR family transcriptional regulator
MPSIIARDGLVTVRDLADAIGIDRSNAFKTLKKLGIPTDKRRSHEARGQFVSVVTVADAERLIEIRRDEFLGGRGQVAYVETI